MITVEMLSGIADAVRDAIALIPDSASKREKVCMGADGTPTSQIDKIAENAAMMFIERSGIPVNILSEEIGFVDNGFEDTLVIDPIDGTSNAIASIPYYTVSLAVGKSALSDIYVGYLRNLATGDEMWAEKGKGAYKNGKPIHVRKADLSELFMMIYQGNSAAPESAALARRVKSSRSFGCASLEMAIVAEGEADGYYMNSRNYFRAIRVVDIAASYIILKEAGGEIYDLGGNPMDMPFDLDRRSNFVAVGDKKVYDYAMKNDILPHDGLTYGVYTNVSVSNAAEYTRQVLDALQGQDYIVDSGIAKVLGIPGTPLKDMDADIVIVIGGDGTLLRAMQNNDALVIGINGGSVGFLAEIDRDHIKEGITRLLSGDYAVDTRFKIATRYGGEYLPDSVNEAVVHTDTVAKIRHYRIYVDDVLAADFRADGIVVSTPTGSTCYAMSLGAPYMDPHVEAMLVVPMAPYKYTSRPFLVPATSKITVENVLDRGCMIVLDGQSEVKMEGGTSVQFMMSSKKARLIRFNDDFYSRVREKLVNGE